MAGHLVVRTTRPPISFRLGIGSIVVLVVATVGVGASLLIGVGSGTYPVSPALLLETLLGGGDADSQLVVWTLRIPRLLAAAEVGAALALSGAIFQTLMRNPLVSPDIIGVETGAALAAVAVITLDGPLGMVAPAAFAGGLVATALIYVLAWRNGLSRYRLVLVGIGLGTIGAAGIQFLLTRSDIFDVQRATVWMSGSLYGASWDDVILMTASLAILVPILLVLARRLAAFQLGDDAAAGLGLSIERSRAALIVVAVALTAICVTVAGPIGFVAFIAPHLARRLARTSGVGVFPAAAAIGALLLVASDIIARRLTDPSELPAGLVTVLIGGPYFLWLLFRTRRVGSGV